MGSSGSKAARHYPQAAATVKGKITRPTTSNGPASYPATRSTPPVDESKLGANIEQERQINEQIRDNLGIFFRPQESQIPVKRTDGTKANHPHVAVNSLENRSPEDNVEQVRVRNKLNPDDIQALLADLKPEHGTGLPPAQLSAKYNVDENIVRTLGRYHSPMFIPSQPSSETPAAS
ncbi:hypothetical protein IWQ60_009837 [Tieghemiomyces parasiticus]|uniref:Uncharacterized protein n=1 Tax=Tieghemiomyces parasiticus TaxID=78921 RepID=A0A9W7ZTC4_9FUNG|nr:hypothetical protein IWQ60_009837 [Tieghemiomyces parasiticus]